ncbi:hypothetical protein PR048_030779 [Dryococelus australis]|uniref:Uncharacterized protein n=1 Tax=Dryococelus australis TaxID=614101 RepID=A0ABQ9GAM2_9NEOP|nr:hypothetical protein PR048_030779 [Dryococelus australis]
MNCLVMIVCRIGTHIPGKRCCRQHLLTPSRRILADPVSDDAGRGSMIAEIQGRQAFVLANHLRGIKRECFKIDVRLMVGKGRSDPFAVRSHALAGVINGRLQLAMTGPGTGHQICSSRQRHIIHPDIFPDPHGPGGGGGRDLLCSCRETSGSDSDTVSDNCPGNGDSGQPANWRTSLGHPDNTNADRAYQQSASCQASCSSTRGGGREDAGFNDFEEGGGGLWEIPKKNKNSLTCGIVLHDSHLRKSGVNRPGIEPGSSWCEASNLTAQPPWPLFLTDFECLKHCYGPSAATSNFLEALPKFCYQDIPPPNANKTEPSLENCSKGTTHRWLDYSPPTRAKWARFRAWSLPDFRMWELCRAMPLVGEFSQGFPVFPRPMHSGAALYPRRFILISSEDLAAKSHQNISGTYRVDIQCYVRDTWLLAAIHTSGRDLWFGVKTSGQALGQRCAKFSSLSEDRLNCKLLCV